MSILGNRVTRIEDERFLTGDALFVGDVDLPGRVHAAFVRSTMPHARIVGIDTSAARAAPGVVGVFTVDDLGLPDLAPDPMLNQAMTRPPLARGVVRFVGEPVVAVVAETAAAAHDATELVVIDYDPLDPVPTPGAALTADPLHPRADDNVAFRIPGRDDAVDFGSCEVVVSARIVNQRVAPCPLEGRVAAAHWDDDRLVHYASSQGAHRVRDELAALYDLDPSRVRVVVPDVGGGFGAKGGPHPEELVVAGLSRAVGRPVVWVETRTENLQAMVHGRAQHQIVTIGGRRDGRITDYRLEVLQDAGAYLTFGAVLPSMTMLMLTGVYDIERATIDATSVVTTTTPIGPYRGAGRPEAAHALERAVDLFAAEIGLDPVEVRRRNLIDPADFPHRTPGGSTYDSGDYARALDTVLAAAGYDDARAEQARRRDSGDPVQLGIGISVYVEITAGTGGGEYGSVEVLPDGSVVARTGSTPFGQGHETTWAMIVSDRLGVPLERITVVHGDTDAVPTGGITGGSRSVQIAGSSIRDAAERLVDLARSRAADLLEADVDDIVFDPVDGGLFHVAGTPARGVDWSEVAATGDTPLAAESEFAQEGATFPFGAHVALVEVDTETGGVRLRRLVAVDDAGVLVNPLLAEGQVHGGLAQGAAQALLEEMVYDDDANPLTTNFADYPVISAAELPFFERIEMVTPTPRNPLGAKGIGESGTIGATPAVHNAVCDALAPFGVRHLDMPCTPRRVWEALRAAGA